MIGVVVDVVVRLFSLLLVFLLLLVVVVLVVAGVVLVVIGVMIVVVAVVAAFVADRIFVALVRYARLFVFSVVFCLVFADVAFF